MSALDLYLYKSNNTIAYKTGSGNELNVKRRGAESERDDQAVNWASQTGGHRWATGERNRASGEEFVSPFTARIRLVARIAKMKGDGYGVFCRRMYND